MSLRLVVALGALAILIGVYTVDLGAQTVSEAKLVSATRWYGGDDAAFGGFSAIEVSDDGETFVALTDRGHITHGKFVRKNGMIKKVAHGPLKKLTSPRGDPLKGIWTDSEGLAVAPDGTVYVSFEIRHRIVQYKTGQEKGRDLPKNPATKKMVANSALEALAVQPDGTILVIPEGNGSQKNPHPVYRLRPGATTWEKPFTLPRYRPYVPVGADVGPDGRLYVLERHLSSIFGFTNRVRRFDMTQDNLTNETILLQTEVGAHDNLEGLAVWQDQDGLIRLTMVSDDNFKFFQVTEIVEYVVPDGAGLKTELLITGD
ncbi:esterase-like activity of phytase family protein [Aliiroseovarius sp. F47248L]|uniref:esterase-like activity of phytase family protein n=1 Tax=Aliiroseovarius sp. F47248L TaxID=2926420 RepID=UPI001FF2E58F|nr:esterase-like activity of phytase family protein [Aliiroseovarius sp. F47248L]MCK0140366.1 esterase-like activity of phytase family protein [Aliiroseovarius sp. F47248L]